MSRQDELIEAGRRLLTNNYRQSPVVMARGEGCVLYDVDGHRYLDMTAGIAVCVLGHGHPGLADAIAAQAHRLIHVSNLYYGEAQIAFAEALAGRAFKGRALWRGEMPLGPGLAAGILGCFIAALVHAPWIKLTGP